MTREDYNLIKKLSPETLRELCDAIYDYDCNVSNCQYCPLSLDGRCVIGHLAQDKEVGVL